MPYTKLRYHYVVTTKHRTPWIDEELEGFLYPVICRQFSLHKGHVIGIGGIEDHIHVIAGVKPQMSVDALINNVKKDSAKAVRKNCPQYRSFKWQIGYACFTASSYGLDGLIAYVKNQKEHHSKKTHLLSREPHLVSKR